ncbi:2OG-Fe(II) oxygenase [Planktomarina temperata]|nr:2OG-Fe(II) oxygenase [Planktomarina temperata]
MINYESLRRQRSTVKKTWKNASPFAHCVFNNFLIGNSALEISNGFPETLAKTGKDLRAPKKHKDVNLKTGTSNINLMTASQKQFFEEVFSDEFIRFLEDLTGISPLYPDFDLAGGGLHEIYRGGYLNVHADFNFHPTTKKLRALNLILYLNPNWETDWFGQLELWPELLDSDPVKIEPIINSAALFNTTETSWHGHPKPLNCPEEISRRSLAVYYYTDWPNGLEQRAKTLYVLTPDQKIDLVNDLMNNWHSIKSEDDAFYFANRYQSRHVRAVYRELKKAQD